MKLVSDKIPSRADARPLLDQGVWRVAASAMPEAGSALIFLAKAVAEVGTAMFGDAWSGDEFSVLERYLSPDEYNMRPVKVAPQSAMQPKTSRSFSSLSRAERETAWQADQTRRERIEAAMAWLARQCRDGAISTHLRPQRSGRAPFSAAPSMWMGEDTVERIFKRCALPAASSDGPNLVFLDRVTFDDQMATLAHSALVSSDMELGQYSPVLQFAVRFARKHQINDAGRQDKEAVMRTCIDAEWIDQFGRPPTVTQRDAIYTAVRFPIERAIRNGAMGGRPKTRGNQK